MERLVLATVWECGKPMRAASIPEEITARYGVEVNEQQVTRIVDRLQSTGHLVPVDGKLKITEQRLAEFEREREAGEQLERATKERFATEIRAAGLTDGIDAAWSTFFETWLQPTIASLGARTYELINGDYTDWMNDRDFETFLRRVPEELKDAVREAVRRFLDPQDVNVRGYLLRMMDAHFIVEASQLSEETVQGLLRLSGQAPRFVLLLDTNVVLSIAGLNGDAKKQAAKLLLDLVKRLEGRLHLKLYVLPQTITETQTFLEHELNELRGVRLTKRMADAARLTGHLGNVGTAYAEAVSKAGADLSPDDFLGPYLRNPLTVLRASGIELFNKSGIDQYATREDVLRDVQSQEEMEKRVYKGRAKSRPKLIHDTVLWYVASELRPATVESPADAGHWVVTEDFRVTGFDETKRKGAGIAVAVQPLTLIQILQFWIGRSENMQQALVGGLRLSLLAPYLDPRTEKVTIRILRALSRFENSDDLPEQVVTQLLLSDALRNRLEDVNTEEEEAELVKHELGLDFGKLQSEQERETKRAAESEQKQRELNAANRELQRRSRELEERASTAENEAENAYQKLAGAGKTLEDARTREVSLQQSVEQLRGRVDSLSKTVKAQQNTIRFGIERRRFLIRWLAIPAVILLAATIAWVLTPQLSASHWLLESALITAFVTLWTSLAERQALQTPAISSWFVSRLLTGAKKAEYFVLGGLLLGVGANLLTKVVEPIAAPVLEPQDSGRVVIDRSKADSATKGTKAPSIGVESATGNLPPKNARVRGLPRD